MLVNGSLFNWVLKLFAIVAFISKLSANHKRLLFFCHFPYPQLVLHWQSKLDILHQQGLVGCCKPPESYSDYNVSLAKTLFISMNIRGKLRSDRVYLQVLQLTKTASISKSAATATAKRMHRRRRQSNLNSRLICIYVKQYTTKENMACDMRNCPILILPHFIFSCGGASMFSPNLQQ